MAKNNFYGVKVGAAPGVYETWAECQQHTDGYPGAKYQGFKTREEAEAFVGIAASAPEPLLATAVSINDSVQAAMDLFSGHPVKDNLNLKQAQDVSVPWTPEVVAAVFTPKEMEEMAESRKKARVWHTNKVFELIALCEHYFAYDWNKEGNADGYRVTLYNDYGLASPEMTGSASEILAKIAMLEPVHFR
jgi:hypothetical protein